ncbi:hypothetical protein ACHAXR_001472 [Thalassiosira sp. AJA248-18]
MIPSRSPTKHENWDWSSFEELKLV